MKWLLAGALLLGAPGLALAQDPPAATAAAAFDLEIDAPDEIRALLEQHLELPRYREVRDLSDAELARLLVAARQNTRDLVATLGYFSPEIRLALQPAPGRAGGRVVRLGVTPGEATRVSEIRLVFRGAIADDALGLAQRQGIEAQWSLPAGRRFTQAGWNSAKQQALLGLSTLRYPAAQIADSLADIDPETHSARLRLTLDSGPAYRLGALVINGNRRHGSELVTRLARLRPGSDYEQALLVQAQQRLADSGYFDSAFVTLDSAGDPAAAPVLIELREAQLQKLVLGLGASTDSGARLSAEHTHHQVPGLGWRAVSKLSLDRETQSLGSELTAPPDDDNWRWVTALRLQHQNVGSFNVNSQSLRLGRSQLGQQIDRNYHLQYDRADTASGEAGVATVGESLSLNMALTRRHFDSLPFPSSGWGASLELGGGSTLGAHRDVYSRVLGRTLLYQPLGRDGDAASSRARAGRLALRAELGAVLAKSGISLPSTQLFLTGGDTSVRGYGYRALGVTLPDGRTSAGRYLALASLEWQRPLVIRRELSDWESALFIDAGAVADQPSELRAKVGLGAGLRWKSPVGPLQMDLAYGVALKRLRLHLNVGFSF